MDEATDITIRCSELVDWAACEKAAYERKFNPPQESARAEHISGWVGSAVHALLAGAEEPLYPSAVRYDSITPGEREARMQVSAMHEAVKRELALYRYSAHEVELPSLNGEFWPANLRMTGTCDLVASDSDGRVFIADLKTTRALGPVWLQLGGYALLATSGTENPAERVSQLAVIHCRRPAYPILEDPVATIHWCSRMAACMAEANRVMSRIVEVIDDPDRAVSSPGDRCRHCDHPHCVVRAHALRP